LLSRAEMNAPGLFFAGHYRDGISLSDCIVSAETAAQRAIMYLRAARLPQRSQFATTSTVGV
jgi:heterodisulfide reductase subunit A-like polyferredoxin